MLTSAGPSQLSLTNAISVRTVAGERELRHSDASLCMRHGDTLQVSAHSASCHKIGRLWRCDLACSSRESGLIRAWSSRSRSPKALWPQNTTASVAHAVRLAAAPAAAPSLPWLKYARRAVLKRSLDGAAWRHGNVVFSVQDDGAKKRTAEEMEGGAEEKGKARQANYLQLTATGGLLDCRPCSTHVGRR